MEKDRFDKRLLLGIAVMLAGVLILANNFNLVNDAVSRYIFRWEMVLMVLGLIFLFGRQNKTTGIILLLVGALFYGNNVFHMNLNVWQLMLPILLILVGVMMIFRNKIDGTCRTSIVPDDEHHIDETAIFGGGDRVITSQQFEGGRVTAMFGGLNFDLLKAKLAPGQNAIDVFCVFGGMKLVVPENWQVKIRVMSLFGGFSDKRNISISEYAAENEKQLIIKGTVIFGGGEIKSYND